LKGDWIQITLSFVSYKSVVINLDLLLMAHECYIHNWNIIAGIAVQSLPTDLCFTIMFCAQHVFPFIYTIAMLLTAEKKT